MRKIICLPLVLVLVLTLSAFQVQGLDGVDYTREENWAWYGIGQDKAVDVFLICPTVDMNDEYNMSLSDQSTKAHFLGALNMERDIYAGSARLYAPYYRQAAMKVYSLTPQEREPYLALAYQDVSAAFAHYLEQENQGRPILLAGFSQGADLCYRLLQEYFADEALAARLVAAYAIGWPLTEEMTAAFPHLKPAQRADDLGVIISFECEAQDVHSTLIVPQGMKALAINPLNWRTDGTPAQKDENPGACFTDYDGQVILDAGALCGCYLDETRGVLKVTGIQPEDYPAIVPGLPEGSYHIYDYQFFFRSLQENVRLRTASYLASESAE